MVSGDSDRESYGREKSGNSGRRITAESASDKKRAERGAELER